jgi:2-methylcitrate dehydratase PrpD
MRHRVRISVDEALPKDAARVSLRLSDGRELSSTIEHNKGTPAKPMSDAEIEAKFFELTIPCLGRDDARDVATHCWNLEQHDIGEIARLCRGKP